MVVGVVVGVSASVNRGAVAVVGQLTVGSTLRGSVVVLACSSELDADIDGTPFSVARVPAEGRPSH